MSFVLLDMEDETMRILLMLLGQHFRNTCIINDMLALRHEINEFMTVKINKTCISLKWNSINSPKKKKIHPSPQKCFAHINLLYGDKYFLKLMSEFSISGFPQNSVPVQSKMMSNWPNHSLFLCLGPEGPLPYSQQGSFGRPSPAMATNIRDTAKDPGPSSSTPTLGLNKNPDQMALFDTSISAVVCKHCGKHFNDMAKFKTHATYHKKERRFPCEFCSRAFHSRANKVAHERVHTGEKPFECKVCNKRFARIAHLKRHETIHFQ